MVRSNRGDASDGEGTVSVHEGVTYAERESGEMKPDLFVPDADAPPLVVYVHGGGWVAETRDNVPDRSATPRSGGVRSPA